MSQFNVVHNRKNTRSAKWDMIDKVFQSTEVLPLWVADMDFRAPDAVNEALKKRAEDGIYGYTFIDDNVNNAIINWLERRHNWGVLADWFSFSPGVVTSLHMAIQAFTEENDKVLLQTPVYTPFYSVIEEHGRQVVKNPLVKKDNYYTIDFDDFEEKLKSGVKAFILCSPHNPVGRVWKKEELQKMGELCVKHGVMILSDEIHADLIFQDQEHTPIATISDKISDHTITCMAPSKTFNLAGLDASFVITPNEENRKKLDAAFNKQGFHNMLNIMGNTAMEAAYRHGAAWLDELNEVIEGHYKHVRDRFAKEAPELQPVDMEGTYLLWIDCSALNMSSKELKAFMVEKAKVGLNAGIDYGEEGEKYMRMNLAAPRQTIDEGVDRIVKAVEQRR